MLFSKQKDPRAPKHSTLLDVYQKIEVHLSHERDYFVDTLSLLVGSGMPMLAALHSLEREVRSPSMRKILSTLLEEIMAGLPLWKSLQNTRLFREYTISLVRIGEESGRLSDNLKLISKQETKERVLRSKIRGAMLYPILVLTLTVVIGVAIAWFILPRLAGVFASLDIELPLITKALIAVGTFLGTWGFLVMPGFLLALILAIYFLFYSSSTKHLGQSLLFMLPGIKTLIQEIEIARLGYLTGTLLDAGLPLTETLLSLQKATELRSYQRLYAHIQQAVDEGHAFERSFDSYPNSKRLVPIPIQQLIAAGEKSGNLSKILITISEAFEAKTDETTKNLSVLLEPILLVIVWGGVVMVALAVILPIYSLIGGLNPAPTAPTIETITTTQRTTASEEAPTMSGAMQAGGGDGEVTGTDEANAASASREMFVSVLSTETGFLNVRSGPGTEFAVLKQAFPGEQYRYTKKTDDWYELVLPDGSAGFVNEKYVTKIQE